MSAKNLKVQAINLHLQLRAKIEIVSKIDVKTEADLSLIYTPGVADVCKAIADNPNEVNSLTTRGNMGGIVSDDTAVLPPRDKGPKAALPVDERVAKAIAVAVEKAAITDRTYKVRFHRNLILSKRGVL